MFVTLRHRYSASSASVSSMDLHEELLTYTFSAWHSYTIVHCMIDAGIITKLECMADECKLPTRAFIKQGPRGSAAIMVIDHVIPRRSNGSHKIDNLRIMHNACNAAWRKGLPGVQFSDETRAQISASVKKAHADGKFRKIYTPERNDKISKAFKGRSLSEETKQKISASRRGQSSGMKGRKHTPEAREKIRQAALRRMREE